jgi:hypothetical protein
MDVQTVAGCLGGTINADSVIRHAAEASLSGLEQFPGYFSILLQIITFDQIDVQVRLGAILRLKNIVSRSWSIRKGKQNKIAEVDRQCLRDNLLEALIWQTVPKIRRQLIECFFVVVKGDYNIGVLDGKDTGAAGWPELLPAIMKNFESNEPCRIHGATQALSCVFKAYQYKKAEQREALVEGTWPCLEQLLVAVVTQNTHRAFELQKECCKIFYMATELSVVHYVRRQPVVQAWFSIFFQILDSTIPADQVGDGDKEELSSHPLWKAKKWITHTFFRFFNRFGRPNMVDEPMKPFALMFYNGFAGACLDACIKQLKRASQGEFLSHKVHQMCYQYVEGCINYSKLYKLIKPQQHFLLLESVFPTVCLTAEDLELWEQDPHEFVRKSHDVYEVFTDPAQAGINMMIQMVKIRTKGTLDMILAAIVQIVQFYDQAGPAEKNPIHKEAALRFFGSLSKILMMNESYRDAVESMLAKHVFPEFTNPTGFLRARAAWVVGRFAKVELKDPSNVQLMLTTGVQALQDRELPVKLEAAMCISKLLQNETYLVASKPIFPMLLDHYFTLVDEIGSEEVISTLSHLIEHIGEDIGPYATKVCERLQGILLQLLKAEEDDDDSAFTALECVKAINTLLYGLESLPQAYPTMEQICQPILVELMKPEAMEFMEDTLQMIFCFTYLSPSISPFMWSVLPQLVDLFQQGVIVDYMREMLPTVNAYISKGTDVFVTAREPDYLQVVLSMVTKSFSDENLVFQAKHCTQLMESILAHCKGRIDQVIPGVVTIVGEKLFELGGTGKELQLVLHLCDVLGAAAYYNPQLLISIVQQKGPEFEKKLFNYWLSHLEPMNEEAAAQHQKMAVIGLGSVMRVPRAQLPQLLLNAMPEVLVLVVKVLKSLKDNEGEEDEGEDEEEGGYDSQEEEEILDLNEDADNEDGDYKQIQAYTEKIQDNLADILEGDVGEADYETPLDSVDPFMYFAECTQQMAANDGFYQQWYEALPFETQGLLREVLEEAVNPERTNPKED